MHSTLRRGPISSRTHCEELLHLVDVMERGLRAPLIGITEDILNHRFANHKLTIGQVAVHTMSWPRYFLSEEPPWEVVKGTCRPCTYPLTTQFVEEVIEDGCGVMREHLNSINDDLLEKKADGSKGTGYILYRLQLHTMVHANQMAFLRQTLDPEWRFGTHFGDMATAVIHTTYSTDKDTSVFGF